MTKHLFIALGTILLYSFKSVETPVQDNDLVSNDVAFTISIDKIID